MLEAHTKLGGCAGWFDRGPFTFDAGATALMGMRRGVWRASRLVECVHGVARMPQARHREMTQGLRDRKGLSRTLRRFRAGHRKGGDSAWPAGAEAA